MRKIIVGLVACCILLSLAACGKKDVEGDGKRMPDSKKAEADELTYIVTNWTSLPDTVTGIARFILQGNHAWLCCKENTNEVNENEEEIVNTYVAKMQADGKEFEKITSPNIIHPLDFAVDTRGHIWCLNMTATGLELAEIDGGGENLKTISLKEIVDEAIPMTGAADFYLCNDSIGNLCVTAKYLRTYCYLFDAEGNYLFRLENEGNPLTAITTGNGEIAICSTQDGGWTYSLITVDVSRQAWGKKISLGTVSMVYGGFGQYDYYVYDSADFYGCSVEMDTRDYLFNWSKLGLSTGDTHVCCLEDGRLAVISSSFSQTGISYYDYCYVEQGVDDRIVLTMQSLQPDTSLLEAVAQFNKSNPNYKVELNSYFPFAEDVSDSEWEQALLKFNTEMISGKTPDIIDLKNMPVEAYSNRGILEDLYPYIQNDDSIHEEDYFDHVFETLSINGRLPYVTNSVTVQTMLADSRIVGEKQGWSKKEFINFLDQYGEKAVEAISPASFLRMMVRGNNRFVDWETGTCHFDSDDFVDLLELSKRIGNGQQVFIYNGMSDYPIDVTFVSAASIFSVAQYNTLFSGNVNPIGYPNEDNSVCHFLMATTKIGISAAGTHKEGAWEFARSILEERQQDSSFFFPIRKASFEKIASAAMRGKSIWAYEYERPLVQEDVDLARLLLNSARYSHNENELISIISDGAEPFFAGVKTAKEAASNIQTRTQLYVGEQM